MLNKMRKATGSFVAKLLAGLLIISFGAWGVGDYIGGRAQDEAVADVGDREIGPYELERAVNREMQRLSPLFGGNLTREQAAQLGLGRSALQNLVRDTLFELAASDLGILVSDQMVAQEIRTDPLFEGLAGGFSKQRFDEIMRQAQLSEQAYIELVRKDIAQRMVMQSVIAPAIAPGPMARVLWKYRNEQRRGETLTIEDAAQTGIPEPSDTELAEYHEQNADQFTAPQYRKATYVFLETRELAKEIGVTEEELQQAFDTYSGEFMKPEQRELKQMILPEKAAAEAAAEAVEGGAAFADVAKERAGMEGDAVDLGTVTRQELLPQVADLAFSAAAEGDVVGPVESPLGWHVLQVENIVEGEEKTLDDVRDEVTQRVQHDKAVDTLFNLANRLEDSLGGGDTLEEAARSLDLPVRTVARVDRQGRGPDGEPIEDLPPGDFTQVLFDTEVGVESTLTEAGDAGYFILRVDDVIEEELKPLQTVRAEVAEAWRAAKRSEAAKAKAEQAAERLASGAELAAVAQEVGGETGETPMLTRATPSGEVPRAVHDALFSTRLKAAEVARVDGGYAVVRPVAIEAADPAANAEAVTQTAQQLGQSVQNDVAAGLATALSDEYGVTIHPRVVDRVMRPGGYRPAGS